MQFLRAGSCHIPAGGQRYMLMKSNITIYIIFDIEK